MAVEDEIRDLREGLAGLAGRLGCPEETLRDREKVRSLSFGSTLTPEELDGIIQEDLDRWFGRFGDALEIKIQLDTPEGRKTGALTAGSHARAAYQAVTDAAQSSGQPVEVDVTLSKKTLAERLAQALGAGDRLRVVLFFFRQSLEKILSDPGMHYASFEKDFLLEDEGEETRDRKLLLLIADAGERLRGPFLSLVGSSEPGRAEAFARTGAPFQRLAAARQRMVGDCNWDQRPRLLTPDFFRFAAGPAADLEGCRKELQRLQNELSVPYLANRTTGDEAALVSIFEGKRSDNRIRVGEERESQAPYRLYRWAYMDPDTAGTRLEIVRRVLAPPSGPKSFQALVENGAELLSEAEVQLRVLIDENLVDSFERREQIDKLVRGYADETRKQVSTLAKSLIDDAYKTAGLLLAVTVAYLLKPDQGPAVLVLSTLFYAAYLLFVRFYYLPASQEEQRLRRDAFQAREAEIRKSGLVTQEAEQALASVQEEENRLEARRGSIASFYLRLAVVPAALLLAWLLAGPLLGWRRESPESVRRRALTEQAERFEALGYQYIYVALPGKVQPLPLSGTGGRKAIPDLTALQKDSTLVAVVWVPCPAMDRPEELDRLRLFHELAKAQSTELQLLTEPVCQEEPGPRRLRTWLRNAGLPDVEIWTG